MKVLYTSFIKPSEKFGGGLVILQTLSSLSSFAEIDYIGLDYDEEEFKKYGIKINKKMIVDSTSSKINRVFNAIIYSASSGYYSSWKNAISKLNAKDYDFVYMDFTRHSFVAKWAHDNKLSLIIRAHNAEADYAKSLYENNKTIINKIRVYTSKINEKKCVNYANRIIVITKYEKDRFIEFYGNEDKYSVIPVCVKKFDKSTGLNVKKPYILLTGSLWFGPNADGTIWFLKNVWSEIQHSIGDKYDLVIAGANPNEEIQMLSKEYSNIRLFISPEDIEPFYVDAILYVAPVFYGAGMKVKVAEALSCGIHVVGTSHALAGYEDARDFIHPANNQNEFIDNIVSLIKNNGRICDKEDIISVFERCYSLDSSRKKLEDIINSLKIEKRQ